MLDSELFPFIGTFLENAVASNYPHLTSFEVIQEAQPTQQGVPTVPIVTMIKAFDRPRGWPMTKFVLEGGKLVERMVQLYETTLNISALKWQDPASPEEVVTASDLLNTMMLSFTMLSNIYRMQDMGISILRIEEVHNEPFENDNHQFEFHPTFILVLTHKREIKAAADQVTRVLAHIERVV